MPIYEFHCFACEETFEDIRRIRDYNKVFKCRSCGEPCPRIHSAPSPAHWNDQERFPNLSPKGDGCRTFPNRAAYDKFLEDEKIYEVGGPKTAGAPHGTFRKTYGKTYRPRRMIAPVVK